jgi:peptidoglycan/LPS O-acetylase OafA/YrhL
MDAIVEEPVRQVIRDKTEFRTDINLLRAISVVIVVLFHFKQPHFGGGFIGVDVFFVISGLLMTKIVATGSFDGRAVLLFYRARLTRIFPALAVLVGLVASASTVLVDPLQQTRLLNEAAYAITLLSNIFYAFQINYFDPLSEGRWLLHSWSLSAEWQFYLGYPIVLILTGRLIGRHRVSFIIGAIFLISLYFCLAVPVSNPSRLFYLLPFRAWEMAAGGVAYYLPIRRWHGLSAASGIAAILASAMLIDPAATWPSTLTILPVAAAALTLAANADFGRYALYRWAHPIGTASYSIYLWHWPIVVYLRYRMPEMPTAAVGTALLLSFAAGFASYRIVERPAQRLLRGFSPARNFAIAAAAMAVIWAALPLQQSAVSSLQPFARASAGIWRAYAAAHTDGPDELQCAGLDRHGALRPCEFRSQASHGASVLVFGDSHAQAWLPRLEALAAAASADGIKRITIAVHHGCPSLPGFNNGFRPCAAFNDQVFDLAKSGGYDHVVNVSLWGYFDGTDLCQPEGARCTPVRAEQVLETGFTLFAQRMTALAVAGVKVTILLPPPYATYDLPSELARRRFLGLDRTTLEHLPRAEQEAKRAPVEQRLKLLAGTPGIRLLDPFDLLCTSGHCDTVDNEGFPLFRDSDHLRASVLAKSRFIDPALTW